MILFITQHAISQVSDTTDNSIREKTQYEMNRDAEAKFAHADSELTKRIREVRMILSDTSRYERRFLTMFNKSQKKWEAYRDSYCKLIQEVLDGGSALTYYVCETLSGMTMARTSELRAFWGNL